MQHLQPNTTLQGGKYRIEQVLGQGGFGITYLARNTVFDIDVAIKEFFMKDENDRDGSSVTMPNSTKQELFNGQMEKFKKEAKRMFAIKNDHIVGVQDLFEENGTTYYVMDYVDGENLAEHLKRTGKAMTEQEVRAILPQILDALKSVHDAGIWHLDLKPANIMVDSRGNVKLIDFGASKQLNAQKGGATNSTAISYTNGYAPREQMEQNYDKFGPWTDIYALGATLYNLLTYKRPPLPSDIDDDESNDKHLSLPLSDDISIEMKEFILKLMQTNRKYRPQSISNVQSILKLSTGISENYHETPIENIVRQFTDSEETIIASPSSDKNDINKESQEAPQSRKGESKEVERENCTKTIAIYYLSEYWLTVLICFIFSILFWHFGCGNPNNFYDGDRSNDPINVLGGLYCRGGIAVFGFLAILAYISYIIIKYLKIPKAIVNSLLVGSCIIYFLLSFSFQSENNSFSHKVSDRETSLFLDEINNDRTNEQHKENMAGSMQIKTDDEDNVRKGQVRKLTKSKSSDIEDGNHVLILENTRVFDRFNSDDRIRNGIYRIVGTAQVVKAKNGDDLKKIARRFLGPDMECYLEVYNGLKASDLLNEGQEINIPRLVLKGQKELNYRKSQQTEK